MIVKRVSLSIFVFFLINLVISPFASANELSGQRCGINNAELIGCWTMDETNGTLVRDISLQNNTGTWFGNTTLNSTNGIYKAALILDGINDYVDVGNNTNLSFGNGLVDRPFSISAWIKPNVTTTQYIVAKYASATTPGSKAEYGFLISIGKLQFYVQDSSAAVYRGRVSNTNISTGIWQNIVAVYDGNGLTTSTKLYINGIELNATNVTNGGIYVAMENSSAHVVIGKLRTSDNLYQFKGAIDEVRIWNRTLSASEVMSNYLLLTTTTASAVQETPLCKSSASVYGLFSIGGAFLVIMGGVILLIGFINMDIKFLITGALIVIFSFIPLFLTLAITSRMPICT